MEYIETEIQGVYIIKPKVFFDARGYFYEAWKQDEFEQNVGKSILYRTMSPNQDTAFSVVYITRRASIRKPSW